MQKAKITLVQARGEIGHEVNLSKVVKLIDDAEFNEGFRGGRAEIEIYNEETAEKIGSVLLYASGRYMIVGCKSVEEVEAVDIAFQKLINMVEKVNND